MKRRSVDLSDCVKGRHVPIHASLYLEKETMSLYLQVGHKGIVLHSCGALPKHQRRQEFLDKMVRLRNSLSIMLRHRRRKEKPSFRTWLSTQTEYTSYVSVTLDPPQLAIASCVGVIMIDALIGTASTWRFVQKFGDVLDDFIKETSIYFVA